MIPAPAPREWRAALLAIVACFVLLIAAEGAHAEQASSGVRPLQAGLLDVGQEHTCAILSDHTLRCWGKGLAGRLGYGGEANVLAAAAAPPVDLGGGHGARSVASGDFHTCAILDDWTVKCWGFGANGRLGYGNTADVLSPAAAPTVDLGPGRTARAITAGASHTCAILDDGSVRCWGNGVSGRLGYGNQLTVGDRQTPPAAGPVDIGAGHRAVAISAGAFHTCVIRDDGALLCWGFSSAGQLGYGSTSDDVGDNETPGSVGPVPLDGHTVRAVSGGKGHTCAILDDGSVRCWGFGADGRLGYGGTANIVRADAAEPVNLGSGRTAVAISAGEAHTCAILDTGNLRCWGFGGNGRLGYGSTSSVGDAPGQTPASAGPVAFGGGRTALAVSAGFSHTCAMLDDGTLRCWGFGGSGRLGYGSEDSVGDDASRSVAGAGPVPLPVRLPTTAADLGLAIDPPAAQLALGGTASFTITLTNRGPDAATAVTVVVRAPAGLVIHAVAASQGGFDPASGTWTVGTLARGAAATLRIGATAAAVGNHVIAAQVASSGVFDPSLPGGDGRVAATVAVPAPPTGQSANAKTRLRPRSLGIQVTRAPRRGRLRTLTVSGRLLLPYTRPAQVCAGKVVVQATSGRRVLASRTVALRSRRGICRYSAVLRPARMRRARTISVEASFLGTQDLAPRSGRPARVAVVRR